MPTKDVKYQIKADDKTKKALASAKAGLKQLGNQIAAVTKASAAIGVTAVVGLAALTKASLASIDALAKTSDKLGTTTEALAVLHEATTKFTTVGVKSMNEALTKAVKRLGEFNATGGGAAARWLEKLNLDTGELAQLAPDELFRKYSESIRGLNSRGEQLAAISALMGDESRALIGIIDAGSEAFDQSAENVKDFGLAISRVDAAKIEEANDAMTDVGNVLEGIGNTIAIKVSPLLTALSQQFTDAAREGGGVGVQVNEGLETAVKAIGFTLDAINGLKVVFKAVQLAAAIAIGSIIIRFDRLNKAASEVANLIPGMDITLSPQLSEWAEVSRIRVSELKNELQAMVDAPLQSEKFSVFFQKVQGEAQVAAEAVAEARAKITAPTGGEVDQADTNQDTKALEKADKEIEIIRNKFATERELLDENLILQKERLLLADEDLFNNSAERKLLIEQLETEHQSKVTAIAEREAKERADVEARASAIIISQRQGVFSASLGLLNQLGKRSKTAAKAALIINKALSIGQAVQNTAVAVTKALTVDPTGVLAARAQVLGNIQVGIIAATGALELAGGGSAGGGGGVSSGGDTGGGATASTGFQTQQNQQLATPRERNIITFVTDAKDSDTITIAQMRQIVDGLKEASDDDEYIIEINGQRAQVI